MDWRDARARPIQYRSASTADARPPASADASSATTTRRPRRRGRPGRFSSVMSNSSGRFHEAIVGGGDSTCPPSGVNVARKFRIRANAPRNGHGESMPASAYLLLFLGALAGGFVSGLVGFGTALMTLGIWLYVLPPSQAVPLILICSVVGQSWTLPSMWRSFDLTLVWPFLIGGLIGVPLGTMLVASADPKVFKLSVGVLILVFSTALYLNKQPLAVTFGGRIADGAIGFAGGRLG